MWTSGLLNILDATDGLTVNEIARRTSVGERPRGDGIDGTRFKADLERLMANAKKLMRGERHDD